MSSKIATSCREYSAGDIITKCRPLIHSVKYEYRGQCCDTCLAFSPELKKCGKCHKLYYCGAKCQRQDWPHHKLECPVISKYKMLSFEQKGFDYMQRLVLRLYLLCLSKPELLYQKFQLHNGLYRSLNDMESHSQDIVNLKPFEGIINYFKLYSIENHDKDLVLKLYGLLQINSFGIDVYDKDRGICHVGSGLYIEGSVFDHCCQSNACASGEGLVLEIRALKRIPIGEEITIDYVQNIVPKMDRQSVLNERESNGIFYQEVDCPGIGHFTTKDFYDQKYRPFVFLPQCADKFKTKFLLLTRKNPKNHQLITSGDILAIKNSNFNGKNPTKFIVHGFIDNTLWDQWMVDMKDKFLAAGDYNVIIVDWSDGNGLPYGQATANTRVVGILIGQLIKNFQSVSGLQLSDVHILGHSLGSHVAGYAGQYLMGQIGRITGLDPAGPYFEGMPAAAKLDPTDAQFVDAIHTDAKNLIPDMGFGTYETSGHLDFYPNGGHNQLGCLAEKIFSIFTKGLMPGLIKLNACNHMRAVEFYTETIDNKSSPGIGHQCTDYPTFVSGRCGLCGSNGDKCAIIGEKAIQFKRNSKTTQSTRFFLTTAYKTPFFINSK